MHATDVSIKNVSFSVDCSNLVLSITVSFSYGISKN